LTTTHHNPAEPKTYAHQVVANAKVLAEELAARGFRLVTGGTDNHLILFDVTDKGTTGKIAAQAMGRAGLVGNYNSIPFDPRKPFDPSGVRIGTSAITSRGMGPAEMKKIAAWIDEVVAAPGDEALGQRIAAEITEFCKDFPAPGILLLSGSGSGGGEPYRGEQERGAPRMSPGSSGWPRAEAREGPHARPTSTHREGRAIPAGDVANPRAGCTAPTDLVPLA
jgi:hypothetical protein